MPHSGSAGQHQPQPQSLGDFLESLHDNPRLLVKFRRDPRATIEQSKLSQDHKDMLLKGDPGEIRKAVVDEIGPAQFIVIVLVL